MNPISSDSNHDAQHPSSDDECLDLSPGAIERTPLLYSWPIISEQWAMSTTDLSDLMVAAESFQHGMGPVADMSDHLDASDLNETIRATGIGFSPLEQAIQSSQVGSLAVVPVKGPLFRYNNWLTAWLGASSYEIIAHDVQVALANPAIQSILLDIDSPGGEVNGCAELADQLYRARGNKRLTAFASGSAASGAYWIASACDEIVTSPTTQMGSIGVVASFRGETNSDKRVERTIISSQSPYKRVDPTNDEGRARLQARIDELAAVFIGAVARHRGVTASFVESNFGGGDVFIGERAITAGLADRQAAFDTLIQPLTHSPSSMSAGLTTETLHPEALQEEHHTMTHPLPGGASPQPQNTQTPAANTPANHSESQLQEHGAGNPTGNGAEQGATQHAEEGNPQSQTLNQNGRNAEAENGGFERGLLKGREQERQRIGAIMNAPEAEGRSQLAHHLAFETELISEQVIAALDAAPMAQNSCQSTSSESNHPSPPSSADTGFIAAMNGIKNPNVGADDESTGEAESFEATAQRIAGMPPMPASNNLAQGGDL